MMNVKAINFRPIEIVKTKDGYLLGYFNWDSNGKRVIEAVIMTWTQEEYDKYIEEAMKRHEKLWS